MDGSVFLILAFAFFIAVIAGMWRVFEKAGQPGWGCLVPIYNVYLLTQIAGRPGWWLLLFFIPLVNLLVSIVVTLDIARKFGQGVGFALGLLFLGFIFYPILGFGPAQYNPAS